MMSSSWRAFCLITMMALGLGRLYAEGRLFDFGPEKSPVGDGFIAVTEKENYTPERGYGWQKPPRLTLDARNENYSKGQQFLKLHPILCDHVTGGRNFNYAAQKFSFQVDLPPGAYVGAMILGKMTELEGVTLNRPTFWFSSYSILANGQVVAKVERDFWSHVAELHSRNESDFLPSDNLFDKFVAPYFEMRKFSFEGNLRLEIDAVCPINALIIYPKQEEAEFQRKLDETWNACRTFLNQQYRERKPAEETLPAELKLSHEKQGCIVFTRPYGEITPYSRPALSEINKPVATFLTPGEMGTLIFNLLPLRDISISAMTPTDLVAEGGAKIPSSALSVWKDYYVVFGRVEEYWIRPWYAFPLPKKETMLAKDVCYRFRIYVKTPENTPPGDYKGELKIALAAGVQLELPIVVKVLSFKLDPPDMLFGMYAYDSWYTVFRPLWFKYMGNPKAPGMEEDIKRNDRLIRSYFREMKEMGFNTTSITWPWKPISVSPDGTITKDAVAWQLWVNGMTAYKEIIGDTPLSIFGMGWSSFISGAPGFAGRPSKDFKGFTPEVIANAEKLISTFYAEARERKWPEVIFYVSDELSNDGVEGGKFGVELAKVYREISRKVGFRTCSSMNGIHEHQMLPHLDIAIPNGAFPITEETVAKIREAGCELWFYNIGANRFSCGYYLLKARPKGRLQWSFCGTHGPADMVQFLPSMGSLSYAGILDSQLNLARRVDVEEMRQGILDYRYAITLERLARENAKSSIAKVAAAAAKGDELLRRTTDGLVMDIRHYSRVGAWPPKTCDRLRWMIASAIIEIEEAKKK